MGTTAKQLVDFITQAMSWRVWQDDGELKLYLYCLARASHNTYNWQGFSVRPGDMPYAEREVAKALYWSRNKLDRKLEQLLEAGVITLTPMAGRGTMLHIVQWPQNETVVIGSNSEPNWPQNETTIDGHEMEPNWPQNRANVQAVCYEMEPHRLQNGANNHAIGSKTEPNPIKKKSISSSQDAEPKGFTDIWIAYPAMRRTQRSEAAALVTKALKDGATIQALLEALEADKRSEAWGQEQGRFIPGIVKWLQKETWRGFIHPEALKEDDEQWISR